MPHKDINGARIYHQVHGGNGLPPLVLAHGLGGNHAMWLGQTAALKEKFRVILWDCRGHGRSEVTDAGYSIDQFVRDQRELLRELGVERAHIGGLSMGGWIAWSFAAEYPEMTASLLLCDSAGFHQGMDDKWLEDKKSMFELSALVAETRGRGAIADATVELMFSRDFIDNNPEAVALVKKQISEDPSLGFARTVRHMFIEYWNKPPGGIEEKLASISAPTLIIAGELDQLTPPPTQEALRDAIPGARLEMIKGSGHVPPVEKPEEWRALAMPFLESVRI